MRKANRQWRSAGYVAKEHEPTRVVFGTAEILEFDPADADLAEEESEPEEEEESSEEDPAEAATLEEARRQQRREELVAGALRCLFERRPGAAVRLDDLPELLASVNVRNFSPRLLGYSTLERFARAQPRELLLYDARSRTIWPPG